MQGYDWRKVGFAKITQAGRPIQGGVKMMDEGWMFVRRDNGRNLFRRKPQSRDVAVLNFIRMADGDSLLGKIRQKAMSDSGRASPRLKQSVVMDVHQFFTNQSRKTSSILVTPLNSLNFGV